MAKIDSENHQNKYLNQPAYVLNGNQLYNKVEYSLNAARLKLSFKRSFWIVFTAIATIQVFTLLLTGVYGFFEEVYPGSYYLYNQISSIIWYILFTLIVISDLRTEGINSAELFNLNLSLDRTQTLQILKYFLGCAVFVIGMSLIIKEPELDLIHQNNLTKIFTFLTTVIMAPICEEMIFRGYLYNAMFKVFKRTPERLVVNAMLFAAAHVFLVTFLIGAVIPYYIFVLGYLLAKLYEDTNSILPCIILHALNNGLVFAIDFIKMG